MPNEELLRIEKNGLRLILSCCGGVASQQCQEGAGQILVQTLVDGGPEAGICLTLLHVEGLGAAVHAMMLRMLAMTSLSVDERLSHYQLEIAALELRLQGMREGLAVLQDDLLAGEVPDEGGA